MGKKPAAGKGKKEVAKKDAYKSSSFYEVGGDSIKRKGKQCPKCGNGVFMATHKNRNSCGKCGYTEMN